MTNLNWRLIIEIIGGVLFVLLLVWYFFIRSTTALAPTDTAIQQTFNQSGSRTSADTSAGTDSTNAAARIESPISKQRIFKISAGPVAGATFMQELRPTTPIARFV